MSATAEARQESSVTKELVIEAPQERAFRVFTEKMGAWWPGSHHIGKSPMKDALLDPRVGGRWYEVGEDGSTCDWGKVLVWEPPRRVVLSWQISAAWTFDPALVTELEVRFIPEGPQRTRVQLEHRNLERYGPQAEALRQRFESAGGWSLLLASFAATCRAG
jgi:uncharacterized protein YndB with AHSA1/START domain